MFFFWLVNGGIGTACARWFTGKTGGSSRRVLACLSSLLAGLPVVLIILIRTFRSVFFLHGGSVGFHETAGYVLLMTGCYSFLVGFSLPYSFHVIRRVEPSYRGAWIYILDNIGDTAGGIVFTFLLVVFLLPIQAAVFTGALLLLASFWMLYGTPGRRISAVSIHAAGIAVMAVCLIAGTQTRIDSGVGEPVRISDSAYGRISVWRNGELYTLYSDGMPLLFGTDIANAEEAVHYPLSQLPAGRELLVISGKGGIMVEIEKHLPAAVDYVELNPEIAGAGFDYGIYKKYPWVTIIHMDGRRYLQRMSQKKYDAVLINLPEPSNFQLNRFYTQDFYYLVKQRMQAGGVLCFAVSGIENYITESQGRKISSLYNTASRVFENVMVIPGQQSYFLCSDGNLDMDIPGLLRAKNVETSYIDGYFYGNVSQRKIDAVNSCIDPEANLNTDLSPYLIQTAILQWFEKFQSTPYLLAIIAIALLLSYLGRQSAGSFLLFSTGYVIMSFEILVIFIVQIYFGYVYEMIGFIVSVFLGGLLPGAFFALKRKPSCVTLLVRSDAAIIGLLGLFLFVLFTIGSSSFVGVFIFMGFTASFLGGFQVPVLLQRSGDTESGLARFFTADLIGAAVGIMVTSVVIIPLAGFIWAVISLIALKVASLLVIACKKR